MKTTKLCLKRFKGKREGYYFRDEHTNRIFNFVRELDGIGWVIWEDKYSNFVRCNTVPISTLKRAKQYFVKIYIPKLKKG